MFPLEKLLKEHVECTRILFKKNIEFHLKSLSIVLNKLKPFQSH